MTKEGWQYTAIFLASVLFMSNAAQFYSRRVLENELASYKDAQSSSISSSAEPPAIADPIIENYNPVEVIGLRPDERCISGQRFRRIPNGWEDVGTC